MHHQLHKEVQKKKNTTQQYRSNRPARKHYHSRMHCRWYSCLQLVTCKRKRQHPHQENKWATRSQSYRIQNFRLGGCRPWRGRCRRRPRGRCCRRRRRRPAHLPPRTPPRRTACSPSSPSHPSPYSPTDSISPSRARFLRLMTKEKTNSMSKKFHGLSQTKPVNDRNRSLLLNNPPIHDTKSTEMTTNTPRNRPAPMSPIQPKRYGKIKRKTPKKNYPERKGGWIARLPYPDCSRGISGFGRINQRTPRGIVPPRRRRRDDDDDDDEGRRRRSREGFLLIKKNTDKRKS